MQRWSRLSPTAPADSSFRPVNLLAFVSLTAGTAVGATPRVRYSTSSEIGTYSVRETRIEGMASVQRESARHQSKLAEQDLIPSILTANLNSIA